MAVLEVSIIAIVCLLAGIGAGFFFGRRGNQQVKQNEALQEQLAANEQTLKEYKDEVMDHFEESAELINNLTEAYRNVHNHLAEGANRLTPSTLEGPILKNLPDQDTLDAISPSPVQGDISAPLDYAPKSPSDSGPGMLDESYGLNKEEDLSIRPVESKIS